MYMIKIYIFLLGFLTQYLYLAYVDIFFREGKVGGKIGWARLGESERKTVAVRLDCVLPPPLLIICVSVFSVDARPN